MVSLEVSLPGDFDFLDSLEKNFSIFVNGHEHKCHDYRVISFSPRVRRMFLCDQTLRSITYKPEDKDKGNNFKYIIDFMYGKQIDIRRDNVNFFYKAADYFENGSLMKATAEYLLNISYNDSIKKGGSLFAMEIPLVYIAKNFNSMDIEQMKLLPRDWIDSILSEIDEDPTVDKSLVFPLVKHIVNTWQRNYPDVIMQFSHVSFAELTSSEVDEFIKICPPEAISGPLWKAICKRLKKPIIYDTQEQQSLDASDQEENFPYQNEPFKGVLAYLKSQNFIDKELITDCGGDKQWAIHNLMDYYNSSNYWENAVSNGDQGQYLEENQWVVIGFNSFKLRLTHYTISHSLNAPNSAQPKHWKVLGSNDFENWVQVDEVFDAKELNFTRTMHTYKVANPTQYFHYFKIVQLENFSRKQAWTYKFVLDGIEFFGNLVQN